VSAAKHRTALSEVGDVYDLWGGVDVARSVIDAYREVYEKGKANNLTDHVGEAIFGLLRDDPGGHFAAGYRDGAAGKRFRPPADGKDAKDPNRSKKTSFW
jgi:hypothetical protein